MSSAKKEKLMIVYESAVYKRSATRSHGAKSLNHPAIDGLSNTPPQDEESEKKRGHKDEERESKPKTER